MALCCCRAFKSIPRGLFVDEARYRSNKFAWRLAKSFVHSTLWQHETGRAARDPYAVAGIRRSPHTKASPGHLLPPYRSLHSSRCRFAVSTTRKPRPRSGDLMKWTYRNWPAQCLSRPQAIPGYPLVTNLAPAGLITARICLRAVIDSHTPERIPSQNSLRVWPAQFRSRRPGAVLKPFWTPSRSRPHKPDNPANLSTRPCLSPPLPSRTSYGA